ncbi:MAG TPA: hypothetical protein VJP02_04620 [Candidatus Sulfotelmatobacter sp.]|nr:hypothetical protein [Candidatus Sulfotelmatobacter sp.]
MKTLNGLEESRGQHLQSMGRYRDDWNWGRQWEGVSVDDQANYLTILRAEALQKIRTCVDQWIDSGKLDGSEAPETRTLAKAPKACAEALAFWEESRNITERSGSIPVLHLSPKFSAGDPEAIDWKARRVIFGVLFSKLRFRIAKCRFAKCGRYFILGNNRKKQTYKNGLFCCIEHNRAESAIRNVGNRRKKATEQLIEWAAREALRVGRNAGEAQIKEAIVRRLNERIAKDANQTRDEIKTNWVTMFWDKIQQKKEALKYAN